MKAYCINLERSTDRKEKMAEQFEREDLEVEFVPAVDAKDLDSHPKISKGDYANALSHQKIWKDMIDNGHETAIVFEDQCLIKDGFSQFILKLELPEKWDVIYLGYCLPRFFGPGNADMDLGKAIGTWTYMISLEGAKKLVNLDPLDYWLIPDSHLAFLPIRTFYVKNNQSKRNDSLNSIILGGSSHPVFGVLKHFKRGALKWLTAGHTIIHVCQFYPILEVLFFILVAILVKRISYP
jgi:hypothetical protein